MGKKIFVIPYIAWHNECDGSNIFFGFGSTVPKNKCRVLKQFTEFFYFERVT